MYTILENEAKKLAGRPKRDDTTERANLKLNTDIRKILKNLAILNGRSESAQVERLVIEAEALSRLLKKNTSLAANLLPALNEEIQIIQIEVLSEE